jgi:hypothetical protein
MSFSFVRRLLVVASLSSPISCGLYGSHPAPDPSRGSAPNSAPSPDEVEQVRLYIGEVPADVRCVRITAVGTGRTVERELDVTGGTALTESLSGLPIGTVTFTGEAFAAACSGVTRATIGAWASAPVQASIVLGRLTTVELMMVRNGRAKVDVTFTEEAACTALNAACRVNSECCSKKCTAGLCVPGGDAGTE